MTQQCSPLSERGAASLSSTQATRCGMHLSCAQSRAFVCKPHALALGTGQTNNSSLALDVASALISIRQGAWLTCLSGLEADQVATEPGRHPLRRQLCQLALLGSLQAQSASGYVGQNGHLEDLGSRVLRNLALSGLPAVSAYLS